MKTNKRRNPRMSTDLIAQVEILPEKTTFLGWLANLNKDGVLFQTTYGKRNDNAEVLIPFDDNGQPIRFA